MAAQRRADNRLQGAFQQLGGGAPENPDLFLDNSASANAAPDYAKEISPARLAKNVCFRSFP
jgi:hypothetical protein